MAAAEMMKLDEARALFLHGQAMTRPVDAGATSASALRLIEQLGFVQLDSISIVERAHHHILWTRMHQYRPALLEQLQRSGRIFEHWTHDASVIPAKWFPHWRHRFDRIAWGSWLKERLGAEGDRIVQHVMDRIRDGGPAMARDFEHSGQRSGPWWDWKPAKAALEFAWRKGDLAVPRREGFEKVYDLTERVLPRVWMLDAPSHDEHIDWACRGALERLGVATPREIAQFWNAITAAQAAAWCAERAKRGEITPVHIAAEKPRAAFAFPGWRRRISQSPALPAEMRLLSPFDPIIRDRARCLRLFGFDYRFEAFVPEAKRRYGYYVLPVLRGDRLIARLDPKLDRKAGTLLIRRIWWEPGVRATRAMADELHAAALRYAAFARAGAVEIQR